ncbi:hypothetical protein B0H17DRAFT_1124950 [Mycena rosella]|uniref:Uncharacterized protein n=1 Tax=Mycena rosella TaxID=1033263 RepID=A0AAD7GYW5_MYCRO|nr:hypothetical protein B0H17DRAFT_1124950 [Mycena rosella]
MGIPQRDSYLALFIACGSESGPTIDAQPSAIAQSSIANRLHSPLRSFKGEHKFDNGNNAFPVHYPLSDCWPYLDIATHPGIGRGVKYSDYQGSLKDICRHWYTDPTLPEPWSTDWLYWPALFTLFGQSVDGKLKVKIIFEYVFGVSGTVKPVMFLRGFNDLFFFRAGGRYYCFDDGVFTVHRMDFESPKEFLAHVLQVEEKEYWPDVDVPKRPGTAIRYI